MSEYKAAWSKYHQLAEKSRTGDKDAFADKAKAMNDIRAIERQAAREGTVLAAVHTGDGKYNVFTQNAPAKRDLQGEYVRKFDPEKTAMIGGKEQTLQEYHSKRLLGR